MQAMVRVVMEASLAQAAMHQQAAAMQHAYMGAAAGSGGLMRPRFSPRHSPRHSSVPHSPAV
jgi:hypothetical protein